MFIPFRYVVLLLYAILNGKSIGKMYKNNGILLLTFAISNGILSLKGSEYKLKSFNTKIKDLRKEHKKTQQNMADLLKIRRSTYGEYERGKILPPMDKMKILADYFNVSIDYLIGGSNETEFATEITFIDVSKQLETALNYLKKHQNELTFNGESLDNESRKILIQSLENGLKMAKIINENKND